MSMRKFTAGAEDGGMRLDVYVASKYPDFTRSALHMLFDKGFVRRGGQPAKPSYPLKAGDKFEIDETYLNAEPPKIDLPVIYEDDNVIVINKPAGVLSHSKGALNLEATVASFIKDKITDKDLIGDRAGIVHRLDRNTSGLIIVAKNAAALKKLQKQFSDRKAKKEYIAVVEGEPTPAKAVIDAPIARNSKKPQTFHVNSSGKPALTEYEIQKAFSRKGRKYSQILLKPQSGRTHQLRVHMAYVGHPVVGDRVYGQEGEYMLLHAKQLELTLPNSQRRVFKAEAPDYFKDFAR